MTSLTASKDVDSEPGSTEMPGASGGGTTLIWQTRRQELAGLANLRQAFAVSCYREALAQVGSAAGSAGVRLPPAALPAGYLATTLVSQDEREVALVFCPGGEYEFYLNGVSIGAQPQPVQTLPVLGAEPRPEGLVRLAGLHLRAGPNVLLMHTRPNPAALPWEWYFGAALTTDDGCEVPEVISLVDE
jgi:hypothetical protein